MSETDFCKTFSKKLTAADGGGPGRRRHQFRVRLGGTPRRPEESGVVIFLLNFIYDFNDVGGFSLLVTAG